MAQADSIKQPGHIGRTARFLGVKSLGCSAKSRWPYSSKINFLMRYSELTVPTDNCTDLFSPYFHPKAPWNPPHLHHHVTYSKGDDAKHRMEHRMKRKVMKKLEMWLQSRRTDQGGIGRQENLRLTPHIWPPLPAVQESFFFQNKNYFKSHY